MSNNSNYDNNGNKIVHVKAYNRADGTYVKEHWRGKSNDSAPVLNSRVEKINFPSEANGTFGEIMSGIADILPLIMQILTGFSGVAVKNAPQLKNNFDYKMAEIKQYQNTYKANLDNLLKTVVSTPNQNEYSKYFEQYVKARDLHNKTQKAIYKAEHHVQNNDYKAAQEDIESLQQEINASFSIPKEQLEKMRAKQTQAKQINYTSQKDKQNNIVQKINNKPAKTQYQEALSRKDKGDKIFYNAVTKNVTPDAAQFWNLFSNNFDANGMEYIRQNGQFVPSINNLPAGWQEIVHNKVKQQTGLDDCVGIIFNENSSISKSIANSFDFKRIIIGNLNKIIKNHYFKNSSLTMWLNANNANTVGKIDMPITTVDKEGNLSAVFLDVYDFNESDWNPIPKNGRPVQEAGIGTNYYSIIIVKYPLRKILEKLQILFSNYYIHNPLNINQLMKIYIEKYK